MTLGALVDAGVDPGAIQSAVAGLGLPVALSFETVRRGEFRANYARVECGPEHAHRHLHHIEAMIDKASITGRQKELAKRIFLKLGEAEAAVHGIELPKVHFHEVGAADSIVDIVGAAVGLDLLGVERFEASPIPPGRGSVKAAHGRMSAAGARHGLAPQGGPAGRVDRRDGADHAHRRGDRHHRGRSLRPAPGDDHRIDRPGRRDQGSARPGQRPPPLRRPDGHRRRRRGGPGLGARNQPRRPPRRGRRPRHHPPDGRRGPGYVPHADPDEEEPAGRDGHGPLRSLPDPGAGGDPLPRDDHPGDPPLRGRPPQAPPPGRRASRPPSARSGASSAGSTAGPRRSAPNTRTAPGSPTPRGSPSARSTTPPTPPTPRPDPSSPHRRPPRPSIPMATATIMATTTAIPTPIELTARGSGRSSDQEGSAG